MTSLLTAFYMGRQVALIFYGKQRDTTYHAHESEPIMRWPMVVLAVGAIIGGLINFPGLHWLASYLGPVVGTEEAGEVYTVGKGVLAAVVTLLSAAAGYGGWYLYAHTFASRIKIGRDDPLLYYLGDIWRGGEIGWGFDWFYNRVIVRPYRMLANFLDTVF